MKIYTKGEVAEELSRCEQSDCETDNAGQLIHYTGLYKWKDGTIRDESDPDYED